MSPSTADTPVAKPEKAPRRRRHHWLRWLVGLLLLPLLLLAIAALLLYVPSVQELARSRAVAILGERIGSHVDLERLHLKFPLGVRLTGLYVEDQHGDTLLHAGSIHTRASLRKLLHGELMLDPVELIDVRATLLQATDSSFNFDFILNAFVGSGEPEEKSYTDTTGGSRFAIGGVRLKHIHFDMDLAPQDLSLDLRLGLMELDFDHFDAANLAFHLDHLLLADTRLDMRVSSGEPTPPSYPELKNPLSDIDLRFRKIGLENVAFTMATRDTGDSLWINADRAELAARSVHLSDQRLALEHVHIEGSSFGTLEMTKVDLADTTDTSDPIWLDQGDGFRYWVQDWDLTIDQLRVTDGNLAIHTDSIIPPTAFIDPTHLEFSDIDLDVSNVALNNGQLALGVEQLVVHGGSGNTALALSLALDARPDSIDLRNVVIRSMSNALRFSLSAQPGDLSNTYRDPYGIGIQLEAGSDLRMTELVPLLKAFGIDVPRGTATEEHWDTRLWFSGTPRRAERIGLHVIGDMGSRLAFTGRAEISDHWLENNFDLQLDEFVMGQGFRQIVRSLTSPRISLPQRMRLHGHANGEAGIIRTVLDLDSDMGRITGNALINDWNGPIPDGLHVSIQAASLDLGHFIGDTSLAPMSFELVADGSGLNDADRTGEISLIPSVLTYAGNDLKSVQFGVSVQGKELDVALTAKADAADVEIRARGSWPEEGDSIALDIDLKTHHLHLQALDLTEHPLSHDGRIHGSVSFTTEGFGQLLLKGDQLRLYNGTSIFNFERFELGAHFAKDSTALELDSDALTLTYHSNLGVDSLLPRAQAKIASFFQEDGAFEPRPGRHMDLAITLPRTDWLTEIVAPGLDAIELRTLSGSYDSDSDELKLDIDIPHLDFAGIDLHRLTVNVDAEGNRLNGAVRMEGVERDSIFLEHLSLEARSLPDMLHIAFRVQDELGEDRYSIGSGLRREEGVPILHMDPNFLLNRRAWTAHPDNALHLTREGLRAEHFELQSNEETMTIRTERQSNYIEFNQVRLSTIGELVSTADSMQVLSGRLNGTVSLPYTGEGRLEADLDVKQLEVLGVRMGDLSMLASEMADDQYRTQIALSDTLNRLLAKADADLRGDEPRIRGEAELGLSDLRFLEPFVADYLISLEGALDGHLHYEQQGSDVRITGSTTLRDVGVGVIQTGAVYRLPHETVVFDAGGLLLDNVTVMDEAGNRFRLDGRVNTIEGERPGLDLRLRTDRFELVNSTMEQNPRFFGQLFGSIDLQIEGKAIKPTVRGNVGILDGTALSVVLPGSTVELVDHEGIVMFTDDFDAQDTLRFSTDGQMLRDSLAAQLPGLALDLHILLDERASFALVIDPTTGDQATFSGSADLVFRYDPNGDIHLQGPFKINDGGYTIEFYGLVKKRFDLVKGGTIIWDGDPMAGRMDLQARYRTTAAPYPLVSNARGGLNEAERNSLQARLPFDVIINIDGSVEAPDITFGLDMERQVRNSYPQVNNALEQLSKPASQEELNRQVFGLLVLSTFLENESGTGPGGSSLATTAARNSVNSILTQQLNQMAGGGIKGMDIELGVNTYDQTEGSQSYARTTVDYKVTQRILNDRISIEAGGSVGADERRQDVSGVSNTQAPQYAIAYDMTKDGRLRLRLFHENAYDLYDGELVNNGVALMLTREWERHARERARSREAILRLREEERKRSVKD